MNSHDPTKLPPERLADVTMWRVKKKKHKPTPTKRVLEDSLVYESGWYHLGGEPFTGVAYSRHAKRWLETETDYSRGLKWGWDRKWWAPKKLAYEAQLHRGVLHGVERRWNEDGQLMEEGEYEIGICLRRKKWDDDGNSTEDFVLQETDGNYTLLQMLRARFTE